MGEATVILALTDRRAPHRTDKADDLHKFFHPVITKSTTPPSNSERLAGWYTKAVPLGLVMTGPRQTALPSPPCPGSGRPGVVALDIQSTPEWGDFESAAEEEAFWREHA